jgi:hypothetical protein
MKLRDIRLRTAYDANALPTQKAAARAWLGSLSRDYPIALTLTIKQTFTVVTPVGSHQHRLVRDDCDRIAKRFMQKLNRQAYGKAAERYSKSLRYIFVVEGERSGKHLHLHVAIGNLPAHVKFNQVGNLVSNAIQHVAELDEQYKVELTDSGWMEYISKELGAKDTDNVLWQLA